MEIAISQFYPLKQAASECSIKAIQNGGLVKTQAQAARAAGNVLVGLASVFGNLDSGGDIVGEHAFDSAILRFKAGLTRPKLLLNHKALELPIGQILDMRAAKANELPEALQRDGATGGLIVEKLYFNSQRAQDALEAAKHGELGMSFGYNVLDAEDGTLDGVKIRILNMLELFEVSDVCFPMNALTAALIGKSAAGKAARMKRLRLGPAKLPLTGQMWANQMRLNRLKLDTALLTS